MNIVFNLDDDNTAVFAMSDPQLDHTFVLS